MSRWLLLLCALLCPAAWAEEPFHAQTWDQLKREVTRPTWLVFSASYCSHCPGLVAQLQREHPQQPLWLVLTDEGEEAEPLSVQRRLRFVGNPLPLRHAVDPTWRGLTPYLVLLRPARPPLFAPGHPSPQQLDAIRKAAPKPAS